MTTKCNPTIRLGVRIFTFMKDQQLTCTAPYNNSLEITTYYKLTLFKKPLSKNKNNIRRKS